MSVIFAKAIASSFKYELGFVNRAALEVAENRLELEVVPEIGFAHCHHRKDKQTTIYIALARNIRFMQIAQNNFSRGEWENAPLKY